MNPYVNWKLLKSGVAEIEFYHPSHNCMPSDLLGELATTIASCGENPQVEVIVLRSGGDRTFCAGASFDELIAIKSLDEGKAFFSGFANVINACRKCPKLIIGRVQGKAVGGGVGLAAAVDYCYATKFAAIRLSELNIGIGPFVIEPAVSRKLGAQYVAQMTYNPSEGKSAEWAQVHGLYAQVFETAEEMDAVMMAHAEQLAKTNPAARTALKKVFWAGTDHWDELLAERAAKSGELVLSEFTKQALAKYRKD
ncbi:enoyl-CoA hydratase/isomerase family protein [Marinoscillum furvescens]|nr:enoyl-CoA hydratase/isomerase family protein [Marinoscillum furvescens]